MKNIKKDKLKMSIKSLKKIKLKKENLNLVFKDINFKKERNWFFNEFTGKNSSEFLKYLEKRKKKLKNISEKKNLKKNIDEKKK